MPLATRKTISAGALIVIAVLFVAVLVLVNTVFRGARIDLTENNLYTLSDGTNKILASIDEPINLYLFYSDEATRSVPQLRTYATRVREMLEEMSARSAGKIHLDVIDPLPFSEDEDRASAYGLTPVPSGAVGDNIFFGLAGTNSTNGKTIIPFFQPDKEAFLEYDIAKLIHELTEANKPVVGVISGIDINAAFDQTTRQMSQSWAITGQLEQLFDLRMLTPASVKTIDKEIGMLVLIHPKNLSEDAQYAIDQFVLRGGHLLVFVDPNAEADRSGDDPNDPAAALAADQSSNLPVLFKAWGVEFASNQMVLDRQRALTISRGPNQPPIRHPAILGLTAADMSTDDVVTAGLSTITMSSAGYFEMANEAKTTLTPLLQSTTDASTVSAAPALLSGDPSVLLKDYKPSGPYVLAGRLTGKLVTAFPNRSDAGHLAESTDDAQIILVGDVDMLTDRMWAQVQEFFGQRVLNAFANNGDFVVNLVDNLGGSGDLISIRGRATSQRPFTRVEAIRNAADERFRQTEQTLQTELTDTERKLTELQTAKSGDQAQFLSTEQKAEIDKFTSRKLEIRKELRGVRRQLDERIEALGTRLKIINVAVVPIIVTLIALGFALLRRRRRSKPRRGIL